MPTRQCDHCYGDKVVQKECPTCEGGGRYKGEDCPRCDGNCTITVGCSNCGATGYVDDDDDDDDE